MTTSFFLGKNYLDMLETVSISGFELTRPSALVCSLITDYSSIPENYSFGDAAISEKQRLGWSLIGYHFVVLLQAPWVLEIKVGSVRTAVQVMLAREAVRSP